MVSPETQGHVSYLTGVVDTRFEIEKIQDLQRCQIHTPLRATGDIPEHWDILIRIREAGRLGPVSSFLWIFVRRTRDGTAWYSPDSLLVPYQSIVVIMLSLPIALIMIAVAFVDDGLRDGLNEGTRNLIRQDHGEVLTATRKEEGGGYSYDSPESVRVCHLRQPIVGVHAPKSSSGRDAGAGGDRGAG